MKYLFHLFFFLILLSPTPLMAAEFFVDGTTGNNSNIGSFESPWQTIQHGITKIAPGDTLTIREGIYYVTDPNRQVGIIFGPAGTGFDNKTTIRAAHNERVLITRTDGYPPQIGLRDFVRIERLWMGGTWDKGDNELGGGFHPGGSPIGRGKEIIDSTIFGYRAGILIGSSEHLLVQGNRLVHTGYQNHSHGIYLSGGYTPGSNSQHIIVDNNLFLKGEGYGIHAYHNAKTMIITRNFVAYHNFPGTISQGGTTTLNPPQSEFLVANNFFWKANSPTTNTFGLNAVKNVQYANNFHGPTISTGGGYPVTRLDKNVIQQKNVYTDTLKGEHGATDFAIPLASLKAEIGMSESEIDTTIAQIDTIFNGTAEQIFTNQEIENLFYQLHNLKPGNTLRHKGFNWFGAALTPHALSNTLVPEGQRDFWQAYDDLSLLHYDESYQPVASETDLHPHIYQTIPESDYQYYHYLKDPPSNINQFHVTPTGTVSGDGTEGNPWDFQTALNGGTASVKVQPGDIIWMHGGTYQGSFDSKLNGRKNKYIFVAPYQDERVIIDGYFRSSNNIPWIIYWNLHFRRMNSTEKGVDIWGPYNKVINAVVKDQGVGIGFFEGATNNGTGAEIYGTLSTQNSSHGIYCQNGDGYKTIQDNLFLINGSYNFHCYGESAQLQGFIVKGNAMLGGNNNIMGGRNPVDRAYFVNNHVSGGMFFGSTGTNKHVFIRDNFVGMKNQRADIEMRNYWNYVNMQNNKFYTFADGRPAFYTLSSNDYSKYDWNNNRYAAGEGGQVLRYRDSTGHPILTLQQIRDQFSFDIQGSYVGNQTANEIFVLPNKYRPKRANVIVKNWEGSDTVSIDLSNAGFEAGDHIKIYNGFNYFDDVIEQTYDGSPIQISMVERTIGDTLNATSTKTQYNPFPFTGAFIIEATESTSSPSVTPTATPSTPGDTDGDNDVDIFDYNVIISNFGQTVSGPINGDVDNDNDVDIFDYNLVITNFGM